MSLSIQIDDSHMSRLERRFAKLKLEEKRAALITYIMASDPTIEISEQILNALPEAGADIIELGMAFSDPMADGPTIQDAANRALSAGATMAKTLEILYKFRQKNSETPVILMGYYNPILRYGIKEFCHDANLAGADGLIIVDLPPEEDAELAHYADEKGISIIRLISPTTPEERLERILQNTSGFVYYISMAGVTGAKSVNPSTVVPYVNNIRRFTKLPVAVGFGIKSPEQAREIGKYADAVVVGSAIVNKIGDYAKTYSSKSDPKQLVKTITDFVKSLRSAL